MNHRGSLLSNFQPIKQQIPRVFTTLKLIITTKLTPQFDRSELTNFTGQDNRPQYLELSLRSMVLTLEKIGRHQNAYLQIMINIVNLLLKYSQTGVIQISKYDVQSTNLLDKRGCKFYQTNPNNPVFKKGEQVFQQKIITIYL